MNRTDLKLFTRPTIPWLLECELVDGHDRQFGLKQFDLSLGQYEQGTQELKGSSRFAYIVIGFYGVGTMCCMGCQLAYLDDHYYSDRDAIIKFYALCQGCNRFVMVMIAISVLIRLSNIKEASRANIKALEEHVSVDCSDQWSIMNTEYALLQQKDAMTDIRIATFFVILVFAWPCLECCCIFSVFSDFCKPGNCCRDICDTWECLYFKDWYAFLSLYQIYN